MIAHVFFLVYREAAMYSSCHQVAFDKTFEIEYSVRDKQIESIQFISKLKPPYNQLENDRSQVYVVTYSFLLYMKIKRSKCISSHFSGVVRLLMYSVSFGEPVNRFDNKWCSK